MIPLPPIPPHVAVLFEAFCLLVAVGVVAAVRAVAVGAVAVRVAIGLALWLGITGALGASGVLARDTAPPRFLAVVAPALIFPLWLAVTPAADPLLDRKGTRLNSRHLVISYAVFRLIKKNI